MKNIFTLAVYGTFKDNDVRIKFFTGPGTTKFAFQNILHEAGYDCELFDVTDKDIDIKDILTNEDVEAVVYG